MVSKSELLTKLMGAIFEFQCADPRALNISSEKYDKIFLKLDDIVSDLIDSVDNVSNTEVQQS